MITFETTRDPALVRAIASAAWDRPAVTQDGATPHDVRVLDAYQYFVARDGEEILGIFIGIQQSTICIDCHVCMLPTARGARRAAAFDAFLAWLPGATGYRKIVGSVPLFNQPMIAAAQAAGMTIAGLNRDSVMRDGRIYDQVILERKL